MNIEITKKMSCCAAVNAMALIVKSATESQHKYISITGGIAAATDCKRLLVLRNTFAPGQDGKYTPIKSAAGYTLIPCTEECRFPDFERVLYGPTAATKDAAIGQREFSAFVHAVYTLPECSPCVNVDYLKEAFGVFGSGCKILYTTPRCPVQFQEGGLQLVIMPMTY